MSHADKPAVPRKPRARRRKAVSVDDTPLDYMLKVMRDDEADQKRRDEMAKIAAQQWPDIVERAARDATD